MYRGLLLLVIILSYLSVSAQHGASEQWQSDDKIEREILQLVNNQRRKQNRPELRWDEDLARVALDYSRNMAAYGFFDHYDREGNTVIQRAAKVRGWRTIGENLFYSEPVDHISTFALSGWMASATHRANILESGWTSTGIGIARTRDGEIYITEIFAQ